MTTFTSSSQVDCHFHVFDAGQSVGDARYVPDYSANIAQWLEQSSAVGISHGVLVQPSFLGTNNQLMLSTIAANPDRLLGVAVIAPTTKPDALAELQANGVRGIRLNFSGQSHDLSAWTRQHVLWDRLLELGWHVQVHTDPGRLPEVLVQLPSNLIAVIDHMAKPLKPRASDPTLKLLGRLGPDRVKVKLSAGYRLGDVKPPEIAHALLAELGPSALLWGSDWPCTNFEHLANYSDLYRSLENWLPSQHFDAVLRLNPLSLYWGE